MAVPPMRLPVPSLVTVAAVVAVSAAVLADWRSPYADYNRVCYRTVQNPYAYFASKTAYDVVAGNDLQTPAAGGAYTRVCPSKPARADVAIRRPYRWHFKPFVTPVSAMSMISLPDDL